jgi:hypothetical protein
LALGPQLCFKLFLRLLDVRVDLVVGAPEIKKIYPCCAPEIIGLQVRDALSVKEELTGDLPVYRDTFDSFESTIVKQVIAGFIKIGGGNFSHVFFLLFALKEKHTLFAFLLFSVIILLL